MTFLGYKDLATFKRKRSYTGEEMGKAIILDGLCRREMKKQGILAVLFNKKEMQRLTSRLANPSEFNDYANLMAVSRWLTTAEPLYLAHKGLLDASIKQLLSIFREAENAQQVYSYIDRLPLILTGQDYKELRDKAKAERLAEKLSTFDVLLYALDYYIDLLDNDDSIANPLHDIRQAYKKELIDSPVILDNYNRVYGIGYYTLGGKRITEDEYRAIKESPTLKEVLNSSLPTDELTRDKALSYAVDRLNASFDRGNADSPIFHASEERPQGLTKWDLLSNTNSLREFFIVGEHTSDYTQELLFVEFEKEFRLAVNKLELDIASKYALDLSMCPAKCWDKLIPAERLYNDNYYGFRDELSNDSFILGQYPKALNNGIAVLRPFELSNARSWLPSTIDKQGHYAEPLGKLATLFIMGLEQFTEHNRQREEAIKELDRLVLSLGDELYYIKAYDKAIQLVAELVGLKEIEDYRPNLEQELDRVQAVQTCFRLLYQEIKNTDTSLDKYKEQKLKVLKDKLCTIDLGNMEMPAFRIDYIKQLMYQDYNAFKTNSEFILEQLTFDRYNR